MLEVQGIQAFYGASQALFGVDLEVGAGQVVTLMGRNGMGKTTTVNCIMGLLAPSAGSIRVNGEDLGGQPSYRVAQAGVGLVPEGRQVFPNLSVTENLLATAANRRGAAQPWEVDQVFQMFPALAARRYGLGNVLSGGEQQMLAIGRALMINPALLILDEATEGLAPLVRREIWSCLVRLKQAGLSILVIDKNVADLARIADRHFIIEKGRTVWAGDSAELLASDEVKRRYLGI
ncbi:MAG: ABC transporter ATP-binding protein [Acidiferrobacteraceae bacterium]|jgi:branched-chain amino acid transport system ATP-binding protein|nr:ABC transporter ATP-binding protein [Acidiferrobacteraceae bacterium]MDP6397531.1 ABC transporter ATP-binding protein [Arenicellales bacterium]MDP6552225.1 ABC transporter ATP-binding protein [Arenicellales bacterium]MDP6790515.1 ABC transporter ATP-binding protein [Arenicellales bacterium]MDP6917754.1 ABC transporter ATP-binding protein [Arenicellales bacterium]|tara:strand:+ start:272 stop:973 length:702 start_codon:yes stop_codon:yes gene_type:complete